MKKVWVCVLLAVLLAPLIGWQPALAQSGGTDRPIDMVIVLDNSCSMFPREMLIPGCTSYGSDVGMLRITGADMFMARLGFDQLNEEDYQVGVISLGDEPKLITPLGPLAAKRDQLAAMIANPKPETATRLVPALQMAYDQLTESPNRKESNLPAVVLITDGVPYPPEGQSNADIENLIQKYPNVPVFLMLLKGTDSNVDEFEGYVNFWQSMQQTYDNVYVSVIEKPDQIQDAYNSIVAMLQDTIPAKGSLVVPGADLPFYVSRYIDKVIVTVSYPKGAEKGTVQVLDPTGKAVQEGDSGVAIFSGAQNPVEVISIGSPRLADASKDQNWTIRTEWAVNAFVDRLGSYAINVLSPEVAPLGLENIYLVSGSHSPRQPFVTRFTLQGSDGEPILEPQPVWAEVLLPDGTLTLISQPVEIQPDENGEYEMSFDLTSIYPYVGDKFARYTFVLHAGSAAESIVDAIPIASARLLADIGPNPFIQLLNPARIECSPDAAPKIKATLGDVQSVISGTLAATITGPAGQIMMTGQGGELQADLTGLCQELLSKAACGEQSDEMYLLRIDASLEEARPFQVIGRFIPVHVTAARCTPSPTKTESAFVLPTPRPTPLPDTDGDGLADPVDRCPGQSGTNLFNGCPTPSWVRFLGGILALGIVGFLLVLIWPRLSSRLLSPPPDVYIAVCMRDEPEPIYISVREVCVKRHTSKPTIGGDKKKAHIYISGLKPAEFRVEVRGDRILLVDAAKGEGRGTFRQLSAEMVITSHPGIRLWVASKRSALENVTF